MKLPRHLAIALVLLVAGIGVVESGLRPAPPHAAAAELDAPEIVRPAVDSLRAQPRAQLGDTRRSGVVEGVVFGRTDRIADIDRQLFQRSGLWHLLAASGQNVALVVGWCLVCAWLVGAGRLLGSIWALVAIPAYVLVVGGGPSIVRAGIMGELALVAWLAGRLRDRWHALLVAATILVWLAPGSHRTLGFQLSFACVAALLMWCAPASSWLRRVGVPNVVAQGVAASAVCTAASGPLLLARVGEAPLLGALANIVAVPVAAALLSVGLAAAICTALHPLLGLAPYELAGWLAQCLLWLAGAFANLPGAATNSWPIVVAPAVVAIAWQVRPGANTIVVVVAVLAVAAAVQAAVPRVRALPTVGKGVVRVAMLDVGQGSAQLVASQGRALLVDTGPPRAGVTARVHELGVRRLDGVVLTHDSLDHRGGLPEVVSRLRPRWGLMPRNALGDWARTRALVPRMRTACRGARLVVGQARLDVLHPPCAGTAPERTGDLHNDNAMVVLISVGAVRMLLTSDAESPVTVPLRVGRVDVLQVAHHGSGDPQLVGLLRATSPRLAGVSSGRGNSYGHPHPETLATLEEAGVQVARTDRDGSIVIDTDGHDVWRVRP